ncbi:MAG: hypothetical protein AB8F34_06950 [Akkermansiaceae bacterium]
MMPLTRGLIVCVVTLALNSCSLTDQLNAPSTPSTQGSVGSCHSFVVASMYEERLKREGMSSDLSEKDLFLRVYFRGLNERQEILRQLTMSVDRQLPWTFREGATLDRVAAEVKKHGVLSTAEDPYSRAFKAGLPMYMNQLRAARMTVHRKASEMKSRLGRPLTRAEKSSIVEEQFALLSKSGVLDALQIKPGNRAGVRNFAGNFTYKQVNARRSASKLPHIVKLLEQGSVGAGLVQYPWASGSNKRATSGHAVVLRDYDPSTGEFVVTNPWWLGSFGFKRHDRIDAKDFMRYLDTYGWLDDKRPVAMRNSGPTEVAAARIAKSQGKKTRAVSGASSSGGLFAKLFAKRPPKELIKPDTAVAKAKKPPVADEKPADVINVDKSEKKGLLWKLFNKKSSASTVSTKKEKPAKRGQKSRKASIPKPAVSKEPSGKKKGLFHHFFKKSKKAEVEKPRPVKKSALRKKNKTPRAEPEKSDKPKGLLNKWFKKKS